MRGRIWKWLSAPVAQPMFGPLLSGSTSLSVGSNQSATEQYTQSLATSEPLYDTLLALARQGSTFPQSPAPDPDTLPATKPGDS